MTLYRSYGRNPSLSKPPGMSIICAYLVGLEPIDAKGNECQRPERRIVVPLEMIRTFALAASPTDASVTTHKSTEWYPSIVADRQ